MGERVNIFDIAREAGVSIATVSRVVAGSAQVRPATREKVMRIVEKYNFKPSMVATGLSQRTSHTLGMVLPLIDNPFYTQLCLAAQVEAQNMGYSLMLYQVERDTPRGQSFVDMLIGKRLDGMVISGDIISDATYPFISECIAQVRQYMPVVVINPWAMQVQCPCLLSDLDGSMRLAIRHLVRLGHRRIAMIGGNPGSDNPDTREFAYGDEMRRQGLERYIYPLTAGESPTDGELCVFNLLSTAEPGCAPTALVAFNDLLALGAIKQLKRMGLSVPRDMAVVGCDNQFFAPYVDPPLTTVNLRIEDAARNAVRLLAGAQREELGVFQKTFEPELIVRDSCGAGLER